MEWGKIFEQASLEGRIPSMALDIRGTSLYVIDKATFNFLQEVCKDEV